MHHSISVDAVVNHKGMEEIHSLGLSKFSRKFNNPLSWRVPNKNMVQELLLEAFLHEVEQVS